MANRAQDPELLVRVFWPQNHGKPRIYHDGSAPRFRAGSGRAIVNAWMRRGTGACRGQPRAWSPAQLGTVWGLSGVGAGLSLIARMGAVGGCCLALAHCGGPVSSKIDPEIRRVGQSAGRAARRAGAQGRRHIPGRQALYGRRPDLQPGGEHRATAPRASRPGTARTSTAGGPRTAKSTTCSRFRPRIRRCRSRAMPASPISPTSARSSCGSTTAGPIMRDRLIDVSVRTARAARLSGQRHRPRAGGLCRPRFACGLRRYPARGHASSRHAGAGTGGDQACGLAGLRGAIRIAAGRGAVPTPAERPFELGHDEAPGRAAMRANAQAAARSSVPPIAPVAAACPGRTCSAGRAASSRPGDRSNFDSRFAPGRQAAVPAVPGRAEPVSAYAAPVADPSQGSVVTGRGLY